MKRLSILVAAVALASIAAGLWQLSKTTVGVTVTPVQVGATPAIVFRPASDGPISGERAPVVVIAHGFAGSQQLMQPFALTLARSGYIVVTFDCLGHGRNPQPLRGNITEADGATKALVEEFERVAAFARGLDGSDGRIAVLGHSMASDIVVRYAMAHPDVSATVAVSMFSPVVTPTSPRNLAVIVGNLEPEALKDEGRRVVGMVSGGPPELRKTYGDVASGNARRLSFSSGVEHIAVLYSAESLTEARNWLNTVFARASAGQVDARGPWLGLLFLGILLLAWPLSKLLPQVSPSPQGAGLPWRKLLPVAIAPAILTPLLLWKAPTEFLPILLGDYITVHFALYGLLTAAGLWFVARSGGGTGDIPPFHVNYASLAISASVVAAFSILAFGLPIDRYITSFWPIPERLTLIGAVMIGTLPYFVADEWLTRGAGARWGAHAATKLCFLVSLGIAVALNFEKLFFLILIIPIILIFFTVYGFLSGWAYSRTQHPFAGGIANAAAFAWAIAVTFPMLMR